MEHISIREYARRRGCSEGLVRKSIRNGKIEESAIARDASGAVKGVYQELADQQWSANYNPQRVRSPELQSKLTGVEPDPDIEPTTYEQPATKTATMAKANQVEAVFKAKLRELEYRRKSGELISKEATYRALFALGQEIRSSLQAIPDRVIDEILAAPTRNDAHTVLTREIHDVLARLSAMEIAKPLENL